MNEQFSKCFDNLFSLRFVANFSLSAASSLLSLSYFPRARVSRHQPIRPIFVASFLFAAPANERSDFDANTHESTWTFRPEAAEKYTRKLEIILTRNSLICLSTYVVRSPTIRYDRPTVVHVNDFPHVLEARIGWHDIVIRYFVLLGNAAGKCPATDFPHNQTERIDVGPSQRFEAIQIDTEIERVE